MKLFTHDGEIVDTDVILRRSDTRQAVIDAAEAFTDACGPPGDESIELDLRILAANIRAAVRAMQEAAK